MYISGKTIGSLNHFAVDAIKKPLASAAMIANKGKTIVLDEEGGDNYISNKASEKKIPFHQEGVVYIMDVDLLKEVSNLDSVTSKVWN